MTTSISLTLSQTMWPKKFDNKGNSPAAKKLDMVTSMPFMMKLILTLKFWSSK